MTRTVTNVSGQRGKFRAKVAAPAGYSVAVSPSTLRIADGASATFTVTITNKGRGGGSARSRGTVAGMPFAAPSRFKGVDIAAPATLATNRPSGTASVNVRFGRAGAYTATPHGLVPASDTPGTIDQDPDQTYPSGDDGAGVDQIPFERGAAHDVTTTIGSDVCWLPVGRFE